MKDRLTKFVHWRVATFAAEHGVMSAKALFDRLQPLGLKLSRSQLERLYSCQPKRLNLDVLALLCETFNAHPEDFLTLHSRSKKKSETVCPLSDSGRTRDSKTPASSIGPSMPTVPKSRWHHG